MLCTNGKYITCERKYIILFLPLTLNDDITYFGLPADENASTVYQNQKHVFSRHVHLHTLLYTLQNLSPLIFCYFLQPNCSSHTIASVVFSLIRFLPTTFRFTMYETVPCPNNNSYKL